MPGSSSETQGKFCNCLGIIIVVEYSVGLFITIHGRITATDYVDRLGFQLKPIFQTLFPKKTFSFPRRQSPHSYSWNCSVMA
jgi:hypothetical protein